MPEMLQRLASSSRLGWAPELDLVELLTVSRIFA